MGCSSCCGDVHGRARWQQQQQEEPCCVQARWPSEADASQHAPPLRSTPLFPAPQQEAAAAQRRVGQRGAGAARGEGGSAACYMRRLHGREAGRATDDPLMPPHPLRSPSLCCRPSWGLLAAARRRCCPPSPPRWRIRPPSTCRHVGGGEGWPEEPCPAGGLLRVPPRLLPFPSLLRSAACASPCPLTSTSRVPVTSCCRAPSRSTARR